METKVGIYVRLSKDDIYEESMSIENQKLLLTDFCFEKGWKIVDYYEDEGYTGLNFQRLEVQRLIADAKLGRINLILVKDLSRFGRNYTECGYYEEELFPAIGCRFIALNDGVDTAHEINDMMPFQNLYNEMYSQDLSRRVKTAKYVRAKNGNYIAAYAPYGYEKCDYRLVIDEPASKIVQRIFRMRVGGMSCCKIAARLNQERVIPPRDYYYKKTGRPNPRKIHHRWTDTTVRQILKNENYIGNTVQMKAHFASCKNHRLIPEPPENRIRCENTHEPIIDTETWEIVQSMWTDAPLRNPVPKYEPLFKGIIFCADCGSHMSFKPDSNRRKDGTNLQHHAYTCGTYKNGGASACTSSHWILEYVLAEIVRMDLEQYVSEIRLNEKKLKQRLILAYSRMSGNDRTALERELRKAVGRTEEIDRTLVEFYEQMLKGNLDRETLMELSVMLRTEKTALEKTIRQLQNALDELNQKTQEIEEWLCILKEYISGAVLDRELIQKLVKEIRIGDSLNPSEPRTIEIIYRF